MRNKNNNGKQTEVNKPQKNVSNTLEDGPKVEGQEVTKRVFKIQFDIEYDGDAGSTPIGTSKTVPDMNLTVRQLLENHTRSPEGEEAVTQPMYFGIQVPKITDLTDVELYKQRLKEELKRTQDFIDNDIAEAKAKKEKEAQAKEAQEQEIYERRKKNENPNQTRIPDED